MLFSATQVTHIFTWGEALPGSLAHRWAVSDVRVLDLLISTEYWLTLYCDRSVGGGGCDSSSNEGGGHFGERKHGQYWSGRGVPIAPISVNLRLHHTDKNPSLQSTRWKYDAPSGPLNVAWQSR